MSELNKLLLTVFFGFLSLGAFAQSGSLDLSFDTGDGANGPVYTTVVLSNGKVLVGGCFTEFDGVAAGRIIRLNSDGSIDNSFSTGTGFDDCVNKIRVQSNGKILVVGGFTDFNSSSRNYICRLNADGSLDATFDPGTGADAQIFDCLIHPSNGTILIGGDFLNYDGASRNSIARLNSDGSIDTSFDPGMGPGGSPNNYVLCLGLQTSGKIVAAGNFHSYAGNTAEAIFRTNPDGSFDSSFDCDPGANARINDMYIDGNDRVTIAGIFSEVDGASRNGLARLNSDGTIESSSTFDPGTGVGAVGSSPTVYAVTQNNQGKYLIGGNFNSYDGATLNHFALLDNYVQNVSIGGVADANFQPGIGPNDELRTCTAQADGRIIIGGYFTSYTGTSVNKVARIYGCSLEQPDSIMGNELVTSCHEEVYSVDPVPGADSYVWTIPNGWSGSSTTNTITVIPDTSIGEISVVAFSDSCGYSPSMVMHVDRAPLLMPEICLVTVDSTSTKNIVIWEKPITSLIDSFFVYREVTTNTFQRVGEVPYDSLSEFHDVSVDPIATNYVYKLSILDVCGNESPLSPYHSTVHLQDLGNGNLQWQLYQIEGETNPVIFYRIYRDDNGTNNFQPLSSTIPGGNTTYTDSDFALFPDANYYVDVNWDISCTPTRETVNTTRSNLLQLPNTLGINDLRSEVSIYPNPKGASKELTIQSNFAVYELIITDCLARKIVHENVNSENNFKVNVEMLTSGLYVLQLFGDEKTASVKYLVQ